MHVAFVAPFLRPNTLRYVRALVAIDGVALSLLTCDSADRLAAVAPELLGRVTVTLVGRSLDAAALVAACRTLSACPTGCWACSSSLLPLAEAGTRWASWHGRGGGAGLPGQGPHEAEPARSGPAARQRRLESEARLAAAAEIGLPLILKPVDGVGSRATFPITTDDDLRAALAHHRPAPERVQMEEFVGVERTLEMVSSTASRVGSGTRYTDPAAGPRELLEEHTVTLPAEATAPWTDFAPVASRR